MNTKNARLGFYSTIKANWNYLAQAALWVGAIMASFFAPPPHDDTGSIWKFGGFLTALALGLFALPLTKWKKNVYAWKWWIAGFSAAVLSIVCFICYQTAYQSWTCSYAGRKIVIGDEHTEHFKSTFLPKTTYASCDEWLMAYGGVAEEIWTKKSIERRQLILTISYIVSLPFFVACFICVVQAFYCARKS